MNEAAGVSAVESDRCAPVEIDLLRPGDWQVLRSARLAALLDSPDAFVATLAAEVERTQDEWIASIESSTWAVARDGDEIVGVACLAAAVARARKKRFIESVWVMPKHRRQGLVRKMLWRLETEARAEGAKLLQLWVLETNDPAYDAYIKLDFYPVPDAVQDSWKPCGDGTAFVQERLMVKSLL
jgi:ribosomal protein S18 acetylase RimI-like enzyme